MRDESVFVHPQGLCESDLVGSGTRIWAFAHVMKGARVGRSCNIGEGAFVEGGAVLGDHCTVKNGVAVWDGVQAGDYVFLGPHCVFTNDRIPRSHPDYRTPPSEWRPTILLAGATVGANATIVCGVTLGPWCFVAAGAVVTRDVAGHAMVAGNPARRIGWACRCGRRLPEVLNCSCGLRYRLVDEALLLEAGAAEREEDGRP
jgi:UDP-2-acetamido-3-amino-2,3-dideoxy-glucuronate N-acetyltransferase